MGGWYSDGGENRKRGEERKIEQKQRIIDAAKPKHLRAAKKKSH